MHRIVGGGVGRWGGGGGGGGAVEGGRLLGPTLVPSRKVLFQGQEY